MRRGSQNRTASVTDSRKEGVSTGIAKSSARDGCHELEPATVLRVARYGLWPGRLGRAFDKDGVDVPSKTEAGPGRWRQGLLGEREKLLDIFPYRNVM